MFNKHLPLLHGNVSILPEVRFFLPADAGNCAVQRRIFRNKRVCLPKNSCSWVASSPSQSSLRDASSPKVGALGSPRKVHLFAKASPFEERLPPRRGKMSRSDKRGSVDLRSKDGEGEDAPHVQQKKAAAQGSVQRLSGGFSSSLPEPFSGSLRSGPGSWCCGSRTAYHPDGQWRPLPSCR